MPKATGAPTARTGAPVDAAALAVVLEDLLSWMRRLPPPHGLSLPAAATLARLRREGPRGISALAAAEGVSQPAMSQLVGRLERNGLLVRTASPDDGRSVLLRLTPDGERVVSERRAARAEALATLLDRAPPQDAALVAEALPALLDLARASAGTDSGTGTLAPPPPSPHAAPASAPRIPRTP